MIYNLLEEKWIPVLWSDGKASRVGIRDALTQAGRVRRIAAPNPMDNLSLLRFLVAVLHWCKTRVDKEDLDRVHSEQAVPRDWLNKLDENICCFELLGDGRRFYQVSSQAGQTPNRRVSDLFAYLPAATEINHFRHVRDQVVALCPACCAVGLVRLPACAMQGGQGKSPSINNAPPIYLVAVGDTLLDTLLLNWPPGTSPNDRPDWDTTTPGKNKGQVGILEGFTWQPRAIWIGPSALDSERVCARCGVSGLLFSQLVFKKGRARKGDTRLWRDPHIGRDGTQGHDPGGDESGEKDRALRGGDPLKYSFREAMLWRREARAVLESVGAGTKPPPIAGLAEAAKRFPQLSGFRIACFKPFTKQAKTFDEDGGTWNVPRGLIQNDGLLDAALRELRHLDKLSADKMLMRALRRGADRTPRKNASKLPEIEAAVAGAAAETEHALRRRFEHFIEKLAEAKDDDAVGACIRNWQDDVDQILREELSRVCEVVAGQSPLRRQEVINRADQELSIAMRNWRGAAQKQSEPVDKNRPKRRQGKAR